MHKFIKIHTKRHYSDAEVIVGLQSRELEIEEWFYNSAKQYFMSHFNQMFFDKDQKTAIFQDSFIKLWTQIENGQIFVKDSEVCRKQKNGNMQPMTCSLNTFLFAIARNEYREQVRSIKEVYIEEYYDSNNQDIAYHQDEDDETEMKIRIVDKCIQMMPSRCLEILTLFYIEGRSLDEIMEIRKDKNSSKVGLKSAKYKCMTTLREKVIQMCNQLNIKI